jgi:hypothetical protein
MLDAIEREGEPRLAPRAIGARCPVRTTDHGEISIGEVLTSSSRTLAAALGGCTTAWLFAASLGPAIDEWLAELSDRGEMSRLLLADAFASAAAIKLGVEIEALLGRRLEEAGLRTGRRCAPGYGDWGLAAQRPLLDYLGAERIGITLSESGLMAPLKSISGVIGGREQGSEPSGDGRRVP